MNQTRKLFQLHLSTALVLMFVAAGLVWLNVREVKTGNYEKPWTYVPVSMSLLSNAKVLTHARGWPWYFQSYWYESWVYPEIYGSAPEWKEGSIVEWDRWHLAFNILVALALLAGVGVAVEWVVRRRSSVNKEKCTLYR